MRQVATQWSTLRYMYVNTINIYWSLYLLCMCLAIYICINMIWWVSNTTTLIQNYSSYMKCERFKIPRFIICNFEFLGNILTNWLLNKLSSFSITTKVLNTRNYTGVGALSHILNSYIHLFRLSHWSLVMHKYHTYNTVMAQTLSVSWYFTAALQVIVNLGPNKISQALVNMSKTAYIHQ